MKDQPININDIVSEIAAKSAIPEVKSPISDDEAFALPSSRGEANKGMSLDEMKAMYISGEEKQRGLPIGPCVVAISNVQTITDDKGQRYKLTLENDDGFVEDSIWLQRIDSAQWLVGRTPARVENLFKSVGVSSSTNIMDLIGKQVSIKVKHDPKWGAVLDGGDKPYSVAV